MWWHRERRCRTSNPGISCCLREDERRLAWKPTCVSCCLEKKTRKRASVSRLYTSRTSKYVCHVFPHKDKKVIVNACVKKCVSASLHMVLKKSRHSGCVSTKTWERACVSSWEYKKFARERGCVSSSHHYRAWKRVCVKRALFFVFPQDWNP